MMEKEEATVLAAMSMLPLTMKELLAAIGRGKGHAYCEWFESFLVSSDRRARST